MCSQMWEHHIDNPQKVHWTSNAPFVGTLGHTLQHLKITYQDSGRENGFVAESRGGEEGAGEEKKG